MQPESYRVPRPHPRPTKWEPWAQVPAGQTVAGGRGYLFLLPSSSFSSPSYGKSQVGFIYRRARPPWGSCSGDGGQGRSPQPTLPSGDPQERGCLGGERGCLQTTRNPPRTHCYRATTFRQLQTQPDDARHAGACLFSLSGPQSLEAWTMTGLPALCAGRLCRVHGARLRDPTS